MAVSMSFARKWQIIEYLTNDLLGGRLNSLNYAPVQQQNNGNDCGILSLHFPPILLMAETLGR